MPRKNVRPLAGKPLAAYTIEAALATSRLDRVLVSTDDDEIANVARQHGAEVPFLRPERYATDNASSMSVVLHALEWFLSHERYKPDAVALLAPTTPLRTAAQIDECVALLETSGLDSVVTVTPVCEHPYFFYSMEEGGRLQELLPLPNKPQRRQDLPAVYSQSQAVIITRRAYLEQADEHTPVVSPTSVAGVLIDRESAWDIDTPLDWLVAEHLLRMRAAQPATAEPAGVRRP